MRKLLSILAVSIAALLPGAFLAVPALANSCCQFADGGGQFIKLAPANTQYTVQGTNNADFNVVNLGRLVSCSGNWPFADDRFDCFYNNASVAEFVQTNGGGSGNCMMTDGVHSGVNNEACGSHNVNTYWVGISGGISTGQCGTNGEWLVNVGLTDHEDQYPYGSAMFSNTNFKLYAEPREDGGSADNDDQWCGFSF